MAEMVVVLLRLCLCVTLLWNVLEGRKMTVRHCGVRNEDPPASNKMARIIGGTTVEHGSFPWMVTVHEDNEVFDHVCGGSIINERWILTAAHCIDFPDKPWKYKIYAGLHRLSKKSHKRTKLYKIIKIIKHEDYDPDTFENDIALMKTRTYIHMRKTNGYVNGVCLPDTMKDPIGWATVSGWGHTVEDGENSDILRAVKLPLVSRSRCQEAYEDSEITESMICAGMADRDSCQNDSGGPMVQQSKKGTYTLIGIVSNGAGCGHRDYPGIYTKVAYYMNWMEKTMD